MIGPELIVGLLTLLPLSIFAYHAGRGVRSGAWTFFVAADLIMTFLLTVAAAYLFASSGLQIAN